MSLLSHNPRPHILVFDSGVGGLSVSAEIRAALPHVWQSYLADDAFRPYGEKTEAQICARLPALLRPICDMLRPDVVVIACNGASTAALEPIRAVLDIPVVGVVPAIKPASALSKTKGIAVLGTPGTVARDYVDALIDEFASRCDVRLVGSLTLVAQAEAKLAGKPVDTDILRAALQPIFETIPDQADVDAVVLACTHFPLLIDDLNAVSPRPMRWVDSGSAIARRVAYLLDGLPPRGRAPKIQTAFLTGPNEDAIRNQAFARYGFSRVVSLME